MNSSTSSSAPEPNPKVVPPPEPFDDTQGDSAFIFKNSLWQSLDNIFSFIAGTLISIYAARTFGPEIMGYYVFVFWVAGISAVLAGHGGMVIAVRRYVMELLIAKEYASIRSVIHLMGAAQTLLAIVALTGASGFMFYSLPSNYQPLGLVGVASMIPSLFMAIFAGANTATKDLTSNIRASAIGTVIYVLSSFLVLFFKLGPVLLMASFLFGRSISFLLVYLAYLKNFRFRLAIGSESSPDPKRSIDSNFRFRMLKFCFQSLVLQIVNLIVWDRSELLGLKIFSSPSEIAFYSIAFSLVQQTTILYRSVSLVAGINLMHRVLNDPTSATRMISTLVRYIALVAIPVTFGLAVLSGPLMTVLYGSQYLPAIPVLAIVGALGFGRAFLLPVEQFCSAAERQDLMIRCTGYASVINLSLAYLLIPPFGSVGAAWCNGFSQLAGMAIGWSLLSRHHPVQIPWNRLARVVASGLFMAFCVLLSSRFSIPWISLVVGVLVGVVTYLVSLRLTRALEEDDFVRLSSISKMMPGAVRPWYMKGLRVLIP
jgi:O-antigen/teichoic acid export membrane protein